MADLLIWCIGGALRKTHLQYKANLSSKQMEHYLIHLMSRGLIENISSEEGIKYCLTEKGANVVRNYLRIKDQLI